MPQRYTVRAGDSYARIAGRVLGDQRFFFQLAQANGNRALRPGDEIIIPDVQNEPGFVPRGALEGLSPQQRAPSVRGDPIVERAARNQFLQQRRAFLDRSTSRGRARPRQPIRQDRGRSIGPRPRRLTPGGREPFPTPPPAPEAPPVPPPLPSIVPPGPASTEVGGIGGFQAGSQQQFQLDEPPPTTPTFGLLPPEVVSTTVPTEDLQFNANLAASTISNEQALSQMTDYGLWDYRRYHPLNPVGIGLRAWDAGKVMTVWGLGTLQKWGGAVYNLLFAPQVAGWVGEGKGPAEWWSLQYLSDGNRPTVVNPETGEEGYYYFDQGQLVFKTQAEIRDELIEGPDGVISNPNELRAAEFQEFMTLPDGSFNWELLLGGPVGLPWEFPELDTLREEGFFQGLHERLMNLTGVAGISVSLLRRPERWDDLRKGIEEGKPVNDLLYTLQDPWLEAGVHIALDPLTWLNVLSPKAANVASHIIAPGLIPVDLAITRGIVPIGERLLLQPIAEQVLAHREVARQAVSEFAVLGRIADPPDGWIDRFFLWEARLSLHRKITNLTDDAFRWAGMRVDDGLLQMSPRRFWQNVLLGNTEVLDDVIGRGHRNTIEHALNLFERLNAPLDLNEFLKKFGYLTAIEQTAETAGGEVVDEVVERLLGEQSAQILGAYLADAFSDAYRRTLEISHPTRFSLARTIGWMNSLLRENWLGLNVRYIVNNFLDNTVKTIVSGYRANPFNYAGGARAATYFSEAYGMLPPGSVTRVAIEDVWGLVPGRTLSTADLPWPLGANLGLENALWWVTGNRPTRLANWIKGTSPLAQFFRRYNYSQLVRRGLEVSGLIERTARVNVFIQATEAYIETQLRPTMVALSRANPVFNQVGIGDELRHFLQHRARNPVDFDDFIKKYLPEPGATPQSPTTYLSDLAPEDLPPTDFIMDLRGRLDALQAQHGLQNPQALRTGTDVLFDRALSQAYQVMRDAIDAVITAHETPLEEMTRLTGDTSIARLQNVEDFTGTPEELAQAFGLRDFGEIDRFLQETEGERGFAALFDPKFSQKMLDMALAGAIPNNVVFEALFLELDENFRIVDVGADRIVEIAEQYADIPGGLQRFYMDALEAYEDLVGPIPGRAPIAAAFGLPGSPEVSPGTRLPSIQDIDLGEEVEVLRGDYVWDGDVIVHNLLASGDNNIDLGGGIEPGFDTPEGFTSINLPPGVQVDEGPGIVYHDLNVTPWPLEDASVDNFYMRAVLQELELPLEEFIGEIDRALRPGGRFFLNSYAFEGVDEALRALGYHPIQEVQVRFPDEPDLGTNEYGIWEKPGTMQLGAAPAEVQEFNRKHFQLVADPSEEDFRERLVYDLRINAFASGEQHGDAYDEMIRSGLIPEQSIPEIFGKNNFLELTYASEFRRYGGLPSIGWFQLPHQGPEVFSPRVAQTFLDAGAPPETVVARVATGDEVPIGSLEELARGIQLPLGTTPASSIKIFNQTAIETFLDWEGGLPRLVLDTEYNIVAAGEVHALAYEEMANSGLIPELSPGKIFTVPNYRERFLELGRAGGTEDMHIVWFAKPALGDRPGFFTPEGAQALIEAGLPGSMRVEWENPGGGERLDLGTLQQLADGIKEIRDDQLVVIGPFTVLREDLTQRQVTTRNTKAAEGVAYTLRQEADTPRVLVIDLSNGLSGFSRTEVGALRKMFPNLGTQIYEEEFDNVNPVFQHALAGMPEQFTVVRIGPQKSITIYSDEIDIVSDDFLRHLQSLGVGTDTEVYLQSHSIHGEMDTTFLGSVENLQFGLEGTVPAPMNVQLGGELRGYRHMQVVYGTIFEEPRVKFGYHPESGWIELGSFEGHPQDAMEALAPLEEWAFVTKFGSEADPSISVFTAVDQFGGSLSTQNIGKLAAMLKAVGIKRSTEIVGQGTLDTLATRVPREKPPRANKPVPFLIREFEAPDWDLPELIERYAGIPSPDDRAGMLRFLMEDLGWDEERIIGETASTFARMMGQVRTLDSVTNKELAWMVDHHGGVLKGVHMTGFGWSFALDYHSEAHSAREAALFRMYGVSDAVAEIENSFGYGLQATWIGPRRVQFELGSLEIWRGLANTEIQAAAAALLEHGVDPGVRITVVYFDRSRPADSDVIYVEAGKVGEVAEGKINTSGRKLTLSGEKYLNFQRDPRRVLRRIFMGKLQGTIPPGSGSADNPTYLLGIFHDGNLYAGINAIGHDGVMGFAGVDRRADMVQWTFRFDGKLVAIGRNFYELQAFAQRMIDEGAPENLPTKITLGAGGEWPLPNNEWNGPLGAFIGKDVPEHEFHTTLEAAVMETGVVDNRNSQIQHITEQFNRVLEGINGQGGWRDRAHQSIDRGIQQRYIGAQEREQAIEGVHELRREWIQGLEDAAYGAGVPETNRVLFDYNSKRNWEEVFRYGTPFSTWQMRNPFFWAQTFSANPGLLMGLLRLLNASEIDRRKRNLTSRFEGTAQFALPDDIGPFPAGRYGLDLKNLVSIFGQGRQPFDPPDAPQPETELQKKLQWFLQQSQGVTGMNPWPYVEWAGEQVGALPEGTTEPVSFGPQQRAIEVALRQQGMLGQDETLTGENAASAWLLQYNTNRRIVEMEAEGLITHEEAIFALRNPDDPIWQQALQDVTRLMTLGDVVSILGNPFSLKYASPGEQEIRSALDERQHLPPELRSYFNTQHPYLETYSLLFGEDVELELARVYLKYEEMMGDLLPWEDDYKTLVAQRSKELEVLLGPQEPTGALYEQYLADPIQVGDPTPYGGEYDDFTAQRSVLFRLRDVEPRADEFSRGMRSDGTEDFNWEAYNQAQKTFFDQIEDISASFGYPVTLDEYLSFRYRHSAPEKVAYDLYREWREEAWEHYEGIQPGGDGFQDILEWGLEQQYLMDLAAGFTPLEAARLRADNATRWAREGLPFYLREEALRGLNTPQNLSKFGGEVADILGLDFQDTAVRQHLWLRLDHDLPGMFGERDPYEVAGDNIGDYYYNLTPGEKETVRRYLGEKGLLVRNEDGDDFIFSIPYDEPDMVSRMWAELLREIPRGQGKAPGWSGNLLTFDERPGMPLLPIWDELTPEEEAELDQLRVDTYRYFEGARERGGVFGEWTPLMEKYYNSPDDPQGQFWGYLTGKSLSGDAFDDQVIGPLLNRAAREVLDPTPEQWAAALEYLMENEGRLIDAEVTAIIQEHPDWYELAQQQRKEFDRFRDIELEYMKGEYYAIPWDQRDEWERANPEDWEMLKGYLDRERARALSYPYYAFFYKRYDYGRYYGLGTPPNLLSPEVAPQLSEDYLSALDDMDAFINGQTDEWTELMSQFFGSPPEGVETNVQGGRNVELRRLEPPDPPKGREREGVRRQPYADEAGTASAPKRRGRTSPRPPGPDIDKGRGRENISRTYDPDRDDSLSEFTRSYVRSKVEIIAQDPVGTPMGFLGTYPYHTSLGDYLRTHHRFRSVGFSESTQRHEIAHALDTEYGMSQDPGFIPAVEEAAQMDETVADLLQMWDDGHFAGAYSEDWRDSPGEIYSILFSVYAYIGRVSEPLWPYYERYLEAEPTNESTIPRP